jgi:fatty-acyl-CoA synthase
VNVADHFTQDRAIHVLASLERFAVERPDAIAYAFADMRLSYRQLYKDVRRTAIALRELGLDRGDRCAIALPIGPSLVASIFGAQAIGAAPVVISSALDEPSIVACARKAKARVILAETKLVRDTHEALRAVDPRDLDALSMLGLAQPFLKDETAEAFIQLSSGTMNEPRAIAIKHAHVASYLAGAIELMSIRNDDVFVTWTPPHHELGLVRFILAPMYFGRPSHLLEPSLAGMKMWLETIARERATITGAPDFGYRYAIRNIDPDSVDLSSLRFATNGGEPVRMSTIRAFEEKFGVPGAIRPGYGLAEATLTVASTKLGEAVVCDPRGNVACGLPIRGVEARIEGPNRTGPISIRGASIPGTETGSWFATGDHGTLDAAGRLYVHGRESAMIETKTRTFAPRELEEPADLFPEVKSSAAIEEAGQPVLLIELDRRAPADLPATIADAVAINAGVRPEVRVVPPRSIHKTASGKIRYRALKSRAWSAVHS